MKVPGALLNPSLKNKNIGSEKTPYIFSKNGFIIFPV